MICRSIHRDDDKPARAPSAGARLLQTCQVPGCGAAIPVRHLMCRDHWVEVPADLRFQVEQSLAAWLAGAGSVRPYFIARLRAIIHVTKLQGGDVGALEAQLAHYEAAQPLKENHETEKEDSDR